MAPAALTRMHQWRTFGLMMAALLAGAGLFLAYHIAETLLLVFAGMLLAVVLDAATLLLGRVLHIHRLVRLSIVSLLGFAGFVAAVVWGGVTLVSQLQNFVEVVAGQAQALTERLETWGMAPSDTGEGTEEGKLLEFLPDPKQWFGHAQAAFGLTTGVVAKTVIILFLGLFFAADPVSYRNGFLKLVSVHKRIRVGQVLEEAGRSLRWWVIGQLASMAIVAVTVSLMLLAVGIPNAVLLGVAAGLLNFIPFLGPVLAGIPVLLAAMPEGPSTLMLVMALFVTLQSIEGYLINPMIQKRAVYLAPAWSLTALVVFGALFGGIGVALATPILAVTRILVLRLYVEDVLERMPTS